MSTRTLASIAMILSFATSGPAWAGAIANVGEIGSYSQIYELNLLNNANYEFTNPAYSVDNSSTVFPGGIQRIAYYLELDNNSFVWVSMDAFTQNLTMIGVPTKNSGAVFEQIVNNMNVESNVGSIATGTGISTGNIEFWPTNYSKTANSGLGGNSYDWDDTNATSENYGSMQIHNYGAGQTLLAYNRWGHGVQDDDLGIGNSPNGNLDWTFQRNAASYTNKVLEVWVQTVAQPVPEPSSLALLGIGIAGLFGYSWRRKRQMAA